MKKVVESYLEFLASTAVAQDPRSFKMYGANPIGKKRLAKLRKYSEKCKS